jgi:hypothetical protein
MILPCIWPFVLSDGLTYSIRILLELAIRNCDNFLGLGEKCTETVIISLDAIWTK